MDAVSAVLINKALDGLTLRSAATAHNIANANSAGFRPVRVSFEEALRAAASQGREAVGGVAPTMAHVLPAGTSAEMRLDLELATASETAMRFGALVDLLGRQLQISRIVIRGGQ